MISPKKAFYRIFATVLAIAACPPALAGARISSDTYNVIAPYTTEECAPGNVSLCGLTIGLPSQALGYSTTLSVPSPYTHQPFTVQCTPVGYQIIDTSSVTCSLLTCPASNVALCGAAIPVEGGTSIGSKITVPIPVSALADPSSMSSSLSVTAQCRDDGNGGAVYQVTNDSGISCNLFPCQESKVRLCETLISIDGGTPLGGVLHLVLPPPFVADPFTVQCVGSLGNPPVYQLTDVSAVSCGLAP